MLEQRDGGAGRRVLLVSLVAVVAAGGAFLALLQVQSLERRVATLERQSATDRDAGAIDVGAADAGSEADIWACTGALQPEALRTFLASHGRDVFACADARGHPGTNLTGTVVVRVRFDAGGRTTHVRIAGPLRDPPLEACVVARARGWRTSPLVTGQCATIELPFRLGATSIDAGSP